MKTLVAWSLLALLVACGAASSEAETVPDANDDDDKRASESSSDDAADSSDAGTHVDAAAVSCTKETVEGDACADEGKFCNPSPCTDECQFCNALRCTAGKWEMMEAFPMPSSYCASSSCGAVTCGKGELCVRSHGADGGATTEACQKLPKNCFDCTCATSVCTGTSTCTADSTTKKPTVDCNVE